MSITVVASGLEDLARFYELAPQVTKTAARIAINQTAERKGIVALRAAMEEEIAFPKGYLTDRKRLGVTQRATQNNLEAKVTARQRPTSLARFASGNALVGGAGLSVRVNPNRRRSLSRAFLVRLRADEGEVSDGAFNLGLAVRLARGETITNKKQMVHFGGGLYLLYGPSVDQVFRSVAAEKAPMIADMVTDEFLRQFVRLTRG